MTVLSNTKRRTVSPVFQTPPKGSKIITIFDADNLPVYRQVKFNHAENPDLCISQLSTRSQKYDASHRNPWRPCDGSEIMDFAEKHLVKAGAENPDGSFEEFIWSDGYTSRFEIQQGVAQ